MFCKCFILHVTTVLRHCYHSLIPTGYSPSINHATAKRQHYSKIVSSSPDKPRCLWQTVNKLLRRRSYHPYRPISHLVHLPIASLLSSPKKYRNLVSLRSIAATKTRRYMMYHIKQESRAIARKPRDAAAVRFGLVRRRSTLRVAELGKPGFRAPDIPAQNRI